jgi:hypothetical protein
MHHGESQAPRAGRRFERDEPDSDWLFELPRPLNWMFSLNLGPRWSGPSECPRFDENGHLSGHFRSKIEHRHQAAAAPVAMRGVVLQHNSYALAGTGGCSTGASFCIAGD